MNVLDSINVYKIYNLSFNSYNDTINKNNLKIIEKTLTMREESVMINNSNLHYFF